MYFEQMLFLIPQTQDHATSSNCSPMADSNGGEDTYERQEDEQGSSGDTPETSTYQKKQPVSNTSRKINYEQQLLDILKEKSEHTEEDETFLLSLVPAIKKLNDDQKYWAKMEILSIMKKAKLWCFNHSVYSVSPRPLYHRRMIIISIITTQQQCQILQIQ
jgi:hypothetical protein